MQGLVALGISPSLIGEAVSNNGGRRILGDFEDGLDGWKTNGGTKLSRVSRVDRPYAVEKGKYALSVTANGDAYPVIENKQKIKNTAFLGMPYLVGRILTSPKENFRTLTLVLRYHHRATPADGKKKGETNKSALVEEYTQTVALGTKSTFSWDLSGLSEEKLKSPERLEIGWYVGETPPGTGPRGKQRGRRDPGEVFLDAIHVTDDRGTLERSALMNYMDELLLKHNDYRYESRSFFDGGEEGVFVFADGTELDVKWEDRGQGKERYTIGGRTFELVEGEE